MLLTRGQISTVNPNVTAVLNLAVTCIVFVAFGFAPALPETQPGPHAPAPRITVIGLSNFAEVTPNLYRGGQPTPAGYEKLKKMGVDIVVDLRLSGRETEKRNVIKAGMQFVSIPWHCMLPKDRVFAKFLKLLQENPHKKVFVHCRYGDDRTGMTIAAYRMAVQGWTPSEARKEMQKFGYHRMLCPSLVEYERKFPERLRKDPEFDVLGSAAGSPSR